MSWPECSDLSFQSKLTPFICCNFNIGWDINSTLSFNSLSEEWYAVTSPVTFNEPDIVVVPPMVVKPFDLTCNANLS